MKTTLPTLLISFVASAEPPAQFDGGINTYQTLRIIADDGTYGEIKADSFGTTPGYLEFNAYLIFNEEVFTDSVTLIDDDATISWPSGPEALQFNAGSSSLSTIYIYTPYSLHVGYAIDAGTLLEKGQPIVTGHAPMEMECGASQFASGAKVITFSKSFSAAPIACFCADTDNPMIGCAAPTKGATVTTFNGNGSDNFDFCCYGAK